MVTFPQIGRFTSHTPLNFHSRRLTKTRLQSAIYNLITQLDLGLQKSQQTCSLLLQLQQENSATNKVFNPKISPYISPYFEHIYLLIESLRPPHGSWDIHQISSLIPEYKPELTNSVFYTRAMLQS